MEKEEIQETEAAESNEKPQPTHYVGIGASAGGLEAIEQFFKNMPADTGLTFIVIQHLSPDYKSLMVELLSKKTAIPVQQALNNISVEPNHIYLIPPKKSLTIFHGRLLLKDQEQKGAINLPIDVFFRSLAEDAAERAVAIVLSGTGSDGTRGVRAIKEYNGMVMVQDEESAKFDGMPRAAISTGAADFILPPDAMPEQLLAFVKHPYESRRNPLKSVVENGDSLSQIFAELRNKTKVDFSLYKSSTIIRRLERRIAINNTNDIDEYLQYLYSNPGEVISLYKELLIGVTNFFRDPEAMNELMNIHLPELFKRSGNREMRFWVAGCSSGEEAYTIAMIAKEVMENMGMSRDIKIFATDIDKNAILTAGNGHYPESIAADLNPKFLGKYFYKKEDSYQIVRNIREMVVFAHHNLIKDPPFTNIDLVSCRNLLIYLQPVLQQKAMEMFNFSLNKDGLLFLGSSETVGEMLDFFEPMNHKHKIYRSKGRSSRESALKLPAYSKNDDDEQRTYHRSKIFRSEENSLVNRYLEALTDKFIPLSVIVNDKLEVLHTFGDTSGFFKIPSGKPNYEIPKMAAKDLAIPLSTGIQKVFRSNTEMTYTNIRLRESDDNKNVKMHIVPLPEKKGQEALVAVFLEQVIDKSPSAEKSAARTYDLQDDAMQRIKDLETELQFTKENLQATIEELETANEELQATNEELLASNEELQSTNEELQSTNEELYTVNAEYQNKINELTELNNDVENLLTSSHIGKLLLDENLEIRKFSPEVTNVLSILEQDIGRPISHITHRIRDFDLLEAVNSVTRSKEEYEKAVTTQGGSSYIVRILPYHIGPMIFSGVVITFIDISDMKQTQQELAESKQIVNDIIDYMPAGLFVYKLDAEDNLILQSSNPEAENITGLNSNVVAGKTFDEIWPEAEEAGITERYKQVLKSGKPYHGIDNYEDGRLSGSYRVQVFPLPENRLAVSFEDISKLEKIKNLLKLEEQKFTHLFKEMAQGVVYQAADGKIISANPAAERILGLSLDQMQGRTSMDERWRAMKKDGSPLPGDEHPAMIALKTGKSVENVIMGIFNPKLEEVRWLLVNAKPGISKGEKTARQVFATFEDITERIRNEDNLRRMKERLEFSFSAAGLAWWEYNVKTGRVIASLKKGELLGYTNVKEENDLQFWLDKIHPDDYQKAMDAMRNHIEGRALTYNVVYRIKAKNGEYKELIDKGEIIERDSDGKAVKLLGTVMLAES